jgi:Two component regulator propeller
MRQFLFFIFNFLLLRTITCFAQLPPVGQWREHLPYNSAIDVTAGNDKIYCATPYSLFTVDTKENSVERLSRITGLSETGISAIKYDEANNKLVIAYTNSNIDILYRNDIFNIPDLKRKVISGDKAVYNIYPLNKKYYLSTGLGVVVMDGEKYETNDTWIIGNNGNAIRVNGLTSDASFFYAATEDGLKKAPVTGNNLSNYLNWQLVTGSNGLSAGACKGVVIVNNKVVVLKNDSLFVQSGTNWNLLYTDGWPVVSINSTGNKLELCQRKATGESKVTILNDNGASERTITQPRVISFPRKAILFNNDYWIADQFGALSKFTATNFEVYKLNSPEATASGEMLVRNGIFYAAAGEVNSSWNYQFNGNGIFKFADGSWTNYNRFNNSAPDSLFDFITVTTNPRDESIWAGSFGGGLLHIKKDNTSEVFKQNSPLRAPFGDPGSYRVSGLAFDNENNLWVSNFGAVQQLHVRKNDGNWKSFSIPFGLFGDAVSQILIDDNNYKWIVCPLGNGLVCFNDNNTIDNIADDRWKIYRGGAGNGNLPSGEVICVAKDKEGFIWAGTADGIGVVQCTQEIFSPQGCEAILPIVQQGNFAGYLFKGEEVRSIAVDGANRKWVATKNGVWLISADGEKVLFRFTEENSPLLNNDVKQIAIDGKTGEVYFATLKGICSFRSTATEGGETNSDVLVFPNPVPPGYAATIAIRGLVNNAVVKITELDGRLVYQTRALGGQAVWNGKDYKGRKIASGVYLILVSDDSRTEKTATKIVFISK